MNWRYSGRRDRFDLSIGGRRRDGAIAQLGERVLCKHEVVGSIPSGSTRFCGERRAEPAPRRAMRSKALELQVDLVRISGICALHLRGAVILHREEEIHPIVFWWALSIESKRFSQWT